MELAQRYSWNLGAYLNKKSEEAAVRGYSAQLNRDIEHKLALANSIDAVGVTLPGVRTLVSLWTGKDAERPSEALMPSVRKARIQKLINSDINAHADLLGDQESFSQRQTGKQVAWTTAQQIGLIPANATRVWITAQDERVCAICGPMDGMEVPVNEPFVVGKKKIWTPSLHVNCRCGVKLKSHVLREVGGRAVQQVKQVQDRWASDDDEVGKAEDWEPKLHPRDMRSGRFASKVTYKDPDIIAAAVREAEDKELNAALSAKPKLVLQNLALPGPQVARQNLALPDTRSTPGPLALPGTPLPGLALPGLALPGPVTGAKTGPPPPVRTRGERTKKYKSTKYPLYAVMSPDTAKTYTWKGSNEVGITDAHFTSDPIALRMMAKRFHDNEVDHAVRDWKRQSDFPGPDSFSMVPRDSGSDFPVLLNEKTLRDVFAWRETEDRRERAGGGPPAADPFIRLNTYDLKSQGAETYELAGIRVHHPKRIGETDVSYSDIADAFDMETVIERSRPSVMQISRIPEDTPDFNDYHGTQEASITDHYKTIDYGETNVLGNDQIAELLILHPKDDKD
jgi:hypothetical protein